MSGRVVALGIVITAIFAGVLMYWLETYYFYDEVEGLEAVEIAGESYPVSGYQGLDSTSSPLKLRGCFQLTEPGAFDAALVAGEPLNAAFLEAGNKVLPLSTPGWFDCYDPAAIDAALRDGEARVIVAERNEFKGIDRIVVLWPDGRGVMWRQLNETFAD